MRPKTFYIKEEQLEELKDLSRETGITEGELIRIAIKILFETSLEQINSRKEKKKEVTTLRETILKSVQQLTSQGRKEFTPQQVYETAKKIDPAVERRSIVGSMSYLSMSSSSSYPRERRFLERVRRGVYKLCEDYKLRET